VDQVSANRGATDLTPRRRKAGSGPDQEGARRHPVGHGLAARTSIVNPNDGDLVDAFGDWVADKAMRRRIMVETPAAFYRF
jgi:hypothetical protein